MKWVYDKGGRNKKYLKNLGQGKKSYYTTKALSILQNLPTLPRTLRSFTNMCTTIAFDIRAC